MRIRAVFKIASLAILMLSTGHDTILSLLAYVIFYAIVSFLNTGVGGKGFGKSLTNPLRFHKTR